MVTLLDLWIWSFSQRVPPKQWSTLWSAVSLYSKHSLWHMWFVYLFLTTILQNDSFYLKGRTENITGLEYFICKISHLWTGIHEYHLDRFYLRHSLCPLSDIAEHEPPRVVGQPAHHKRDDHSAWQGTEPPRDVTQGEREGGRRETNSTITAGGKKEWMKSRIQSFC